MEKLNRRDFLRLAAAGGMGLAVLAGCAPKVVEKVVEKEVPVEVTKIVKEVVQETVIVAGTPQVVEKEVTKIVKEVVTAAPAPKEPVTIRHHVRAGLQEEFYSQTAAAFHEAQDEVRVTFEATPGAEYATKLTTLVASGELGDLWWDAVFSTVYPFAARGISLDLGPLMKADYNFNLGEYFSCVIAACTWDNKVIALPMGAHAGWSSFFVNLDKWEEAGLTALPDWEWTYQNEFIAVVNDLTKDEDGDGKIDCYGFHFAFSPQLTYTFIKSWGGDWIDPDDRRTCTLTSDETTAALMFMHDLIYKYKVSPTQEAVVDNMFANGYAATWCEGLHMVQREDSMIEDKFKWQAFMMPAGPGGRGSFIGPALHCINSSTKDPMAAWEWLKWATGKEAGLLQLDFGFVPPSRFDAWRDPKLADNINYQPGRRWLEELAVGVTFPANARAAEFRNELVQGLQAFFMEKDDPVSKIKEMSEAAQVVLDKPLL